MKSFALALFAVLATSMVADAAMELSPDNFDAEVKGEKNAFVKFLAPW